MQTLPKQTTGRHLLRTLRGYGVTTVFGIPGTHNIELYRPLDELGIRAVTARHEQGAGYGADGWATQTGLPGVVITTSGPGLLNALSSAATAFAESRAMIILSPGAPLGAGFTDRGTLHETQDQLGAARAVTAWARRPETAAEAVQAVHDAFELFATGRPRPVAIEIPIDVLEAETAIDEQLLAPRTFPFPAHPSADECHRAAELLRDAVRPVILAGGGSRGAAEHVRALAERLGAPVITTSNGKGVVDEHHPLSLGAGLRFAAIRDVAQQADVLLVVGSKLGDAELWVDTLDARGSVIRVDRLATQLHKNQPATVGLIGDAPAVLAELVALVPGAPRDCVADIPALRAQARAESFDADRVNTLLGEAIAAALPRDAIAALDSSTVAYRGFLNSYQATVSGSTPYMATYATLGYGVPAALGAKIASPERPVFAVLGDGALMFSVQELMTVVEQGLDLTVIVVDNGGYLEIKDNEAAVGIAPIGVDLAQPDWPALARAFGGAGTSLASLAELAGAVARADAAGGLQLIHVRQDLVPAS